MEETFYLHKCLRLVEERLQWRESRLWTHKEFKELSEVLFTVSRISISPDTLKRLFGKMPTNRFYNPQGETKNALALFLGYTGWEDFKTRVSLVEAPDLPGVLPSTQPKPADYVISPETVRSPVHEARIDHTVHRPAPVRPKSLIFWMAVAVAAAVLLLGSLSFYLRKEAMPTGPVAAVFKAKNTVGQTPLTVLVHYDVSGSKEDSIFIRFSEYKPPVKLTKYADTITYSYLEPGYYRAKLIAGNKTLATLPVHVQTNGWESGISYNRNYYPAMHVPGMPDGNLHIPFKEVAYRGIPAYEDYYIQYRNIRNFEVSGDAMVFETRFRNYQPEGDTRCYGIRLGLLGANHPLHIQFINPYCLSWLKIQISEVELDGRYAELPGFGQDLTQWHTARVEVNKRKARIFIDNTCIYEVAYTQAIGQIKGITYGFRGLGSVDYVKLFNQDHQSVYEEEFNPSTSVMLTGQQ